jgi:hypothetical protein
MAYTTINKSTDYFNTKLYTGNGGTQSITGVGFQPDMVWTKQRDAVRNHVLFDAVRGATKGVKPNESQAEFTWTNSVTSFDANGFSVGGAGEVNYSSGSMASWNWKANGQGSSNTVGTINTTYTSANTTAGFSIVSYSGNSVAGATVGHGLGVAPKVVMIKQLTGATNWTVYHASLGSHAKYLYLDASNAVATDSGNFDNVPNANTFLLGSNNQVNASSGSKYIAYCFAEKQGYSKFGSYTGNGNVNGNFIYTGFKPSFILRKRTDDAGAWLMQDNKRPGSNRAVADSLPTDQNVLRANDSSAEEYNNELDLLSNGFKLRADNSFGNSSGATYIYMAFAEAPLVGTNNVPCTAR